MSVPPGMKACAGCGKPMGAGRGVCPECGHMTTWFKLRFYVGGGCAVVALLGILLMLIMALIGQ